MYSCAASSNSPESVAHCQQYHHNKLGSYFFIHLVLFAGVSHRWQTIILISISNRMNVDIIMWQVTLWWEFIPFTCAFVYNYVRMYIWSAHAHTYETSACVLSYRDVCSFCREQIVKPMVKSEGKQLSVKAWKGVWKSCVLWAISVCIHD